MKKINIIALIILSLFIFTGCTKKSNNIEGNLENIMTKVYEKLDENNRPMMLENKEVTDENIEYYLGTKDIEYESALASESGIRSTAHSVVLLRTKDNANIEQIKTKIKENINPRKWICVGVEEKDVIVENKGNLIILILVEDTNTRKILQEGFNNL